MKSSTRSAVRRHHTKLQDLSIRKGSASTQLLIFVAGSVSFLLISGAVASIHVKRQALTANEVLTFQPSTERISIFGTFTGNFHHPLPVTDVRAVNSDPAGPVLSAKVTGQKLEVDATSQSWGYGRTAFQVFAVTGSRLKTFSTAIRAGMIIDFGVSDAQSPYHFSRFPTITFSPTSSGQAGLATGAVRIAAARVLKDPAWWGILRPFTDTSYELFVTFTIVASRMPGGFQVVLPDSWTVQIADGSLNLVSFKYIDQYVDRYGTQVGKVRSNATLYTLKRNLIPGTPVTLKIVRTPGKIRVSILGHQQEVFTQTTPSAYILDNKFYCRSYGSAVDVQRFEVVPL